MLWGYSRVSTELQCLDRQVDALKKYGIEESCILTEKMTGTKFNRPQLDELKKVTRKGDIIVIESLTRFGRSCKDLLELIEYFTKKGIEVVSLKENIDTTTSTGKLVLTILSALAEFERNVIVDRVNEGIASARARGRCGGRPKTDSKKIVKALKLYDAKTHSISEIVAITGVSQSSIYRSLNARNIC